MSHTPHIRPLSALAVILAGGALLSAPILVAEEEAQAQERVEQAEPEQAEAQQDGADAEDEANGDEANGDEARQEEAGSEEAPDPSPEAHAEHADTPEEDEHADNPAVQAYREIAERMHGDMQTEFSGDADADFAQGMIAHHQGAIDMANVVLAHGEDEAIRDLAREIIETQEEEIAFLQDWLAQHGHEGDAD
ncbi:CopM family metallochaperone [Billgrantia lactosivorans]|uniref:CopM family metallochaperone n=1 Tax=Billgrantia lactosivorans TaxID=2185141 RepID=UPI000DABFEFD|nr:DUF305 domain-containing protein [Halomonas lactosivorans]